MSASTRLEPTGGWELDLLEFGQAEHPGDWVGPGFPETMWTPMNGLLLRRPGQTILVDTGPGVLTHLWAFGNASPAPSRTPPMWSSSRWVRTTRSMSSGDAPAAASAPGASV